MVNGSISTYGFACLLASQYSLTHMHIDRANAYAVDVVCFCCCFSLSLSFSLRNMFVFTQTTIFIRLTEHLCRSKSKIDIMLSTLHMIVFTLSSHTRQPREKKFSREHTPHRTTDNTIKQFIAYIRNIA